MQRLLKVSPLLALLFWTACADEAGSVFPSADMNQEPDQAQDVGADEGGQTDMSAPDQAEPDMEEPDMEPDAQTDMEPDSEPDMVTAVCGNGVVEEGEDCDDESEDCVDCMFLCGNGALDDGETCDTGITEGPGACPSACDDADACTTNVLQGSDCSAECVFDAITACADDDGCCAPGCNANNDNDCASVCDNGVVEPGETCDQNCPSCDDGNACTADLATGSAATCDLTCSNTPITSCVDDDGCCPMGCDQTTDNDCSATCGDMVVDANETCDGNCPTNCDDGDVCTNNTLTGSPAQCNVVCQDTPLGCLANTTDGCCPAGCNANTDGDCSSTCGNGVLEPGEDCDAGPNGSPTCSTSCTSASVAFRLNDLNIRDPHIYANLPFLGCSDITDSVPFNLAPSINQLLEDTIVCDGDCADTSDDDGFLDLSFVLEFVPFSQVNGANGQITVFEADCAAPLSSTQCSPTSGGVAQVGTYANANTTCLAPLPNTTRPYSPAITSASGPCFSSDSVTLNVTVSGIVIPLQDVRVAATYSGNPANNMTNGLLRGFLSEADANSVIIPATIDVVGGEPLSSLLPGGTGNCASHSDKDVGPGGQVGWWFYFNFPAARVPWTP